MLIRKLLLAAVTLFSLSPFAATELQAQTTPAMETFFALLNGNNECNAFGPPECLDGHPNAYGSATVTITSGTSLCFGIVVSRLTPIPGNAASHIPSAAHIHEAAPNVNGPIRVTLTPPALVSGTSYTSSGCVSGLLASDVADIRNNPQGHYVNVHSPEFPSGFVRGQLF